MTASAIETEALCRKINEIFPTEQKADLYEVDASNMSPLLRHLYVHYNEFIISVLPGMLCVAVDTTVEDSVRKKWLLDLISLLDVDFEEDQPGDWKELKDVREILFRPISEEQAEAIVSWLKFIRNNYKWWDFDKGLIDSALRYWCARTAEK